MNLPTNINTFSISRDVSHRGPQPLSPSSQAEDGNRSPKVRQPALQSDYWYVDPMSMETDSEKIATHALPDETVDQPIQSLEYVRCPPLNTRRYCVSRVTVERGLHQVDSSKSGPVSLQEHDGEGDATQSEPVTQHDAEQKSKRVKTDLFAVGDSFSSWARTYDADQATIDLMNAFMSTPADIKAPPPQQLAATTSSVSAYSGFPPFTTPPNHTGHVDHFQQFTSTSNLPMLPPRPVTVSSAPVVISRHTQFGQTNQAREIVPLSVASPMATHAPVSIFLPLDDTNRIKQRRRN